MLKILTVKCFPKMAQQCRSITALYITGDKANQNYVTLQPYMDFSGTLSKRESLETSINKRGLSINLATVIEQYKEYNELSEHLKRIEEKRDLVASELKRLTKMANSNANEVNTLKMNGKSLRNDFKELREQLYPIEDKFVHAFLNLPNDLHVNCPTDNREKILYRSTTPWSQHDSPSHLANNSIHFIDNSRYYMVREAAEFDVQCTYAFCRYLADAGNFQQTANPDFVRCVLLEANATPVGNYHLVQEEHLQNSLNTAYLTGGGSFESYLGAFAKLCVYPSLLPLCLVSTGRSYSTVNSTKLNQPNDKANLYSAVQTNAVQTFAAAVSLAEADIQMEQILNLAVDFYKALDIHFRIRYADASELAISECLRAIIEVYSPVEKRYIAVGHVSHYSDFVSRRILFCMREDKEYHFPHVVGGPVLYTSRLIAAMLENGVALQDCKFINAHDNKHAQYEAFDEFKSIFK